MNTTTKTLGLVIGLLLAACSGTTNHAENAGDKSDKTETRREALSFVAPCNASACGEIPPSSHSAKPVCTPASESCTWSDLDPDTSVSYRQCAEAECGTKPDESVCPSGTTFKGAACGSEDEGPCVWRSSCAPPPSTTPCPDADGCGPGKPLIGVICQDGSNGDLACMKQGETCGWERTCD